jgi:hypothetical protein
MFVGDGTPIHDMPGGLAGIDRIGLNRVGHGEVIAAVEVNVGCGDIDHVRFPRLRVGRVVQADGDLASVGGNGSAFAGAGRDQRVESLERYRPKKRDVSKGGGECAELVQTVKEGIHGMVLSGEPGPGKAAGHAVGGNNGSDAGRRPNSLLEEEAGNGDGRARGVVIRGCGVWRRSEP